ncbi:MAG: hypothetical protein QOD92_1095 [Acidimicrobiaceae bacterium]|jgi:hypothetical protein
MAPENAAEQIAIYAEIERLGAGAKLLLAKRAAESGEWHKHGHRSAAHWLADESGTSVGAAVATIETSERLTELDDTRDKLTAGELSQAQVTEIASAVMADPDAEQELLRVAATEGFKTLKDKCLRVKAAATDGQSRHEKIHASRYFRHWEDNEGAVCGEFKLTPTAAAPLLARIDAERERIFREARKEGRRESYAAYSADALAALGAEGTSGPSDCKIIATISHDALVRGHTEAGETCEIAGVGPVPVDTVKAMMEDAFLAAVVTDGIDVYNVAHLGRKPTAHQRTALEARGKECEVVGCGSAMSLEIHHMNQWAKTYKTSLRSLAWVCKHDHDQITYDGFELAGPPGDRMWISPDGSIKHQRPPPDPP